MWSVRHLSMLCMICRATQFLITPLQSGFLPSQEFSINEFQLYTSLSLSHTPIYSSEPDCIIELGLLWIGRSLHHVQARHKNIMAWKRFVKSVAYYSYIGWKCMYDSRDSSYALMTDHEPCQFIYQLSSKLIETGGFFNNLLDTHKRLYRLMTLGHWEQNL
jgi:hypothetical protein